MRRQLGMVSLLVVGMAFFLPMAAAVPVASSDASGINGCLLALEEYKIMNQTAVLAQMAMASGKNLPYDIGKYDICDNIEIASESAVLTKFFVVNFAIKSGDTTVLPGEVGVCLPAVCTRDDFHGLLAAEEGPLADLAKASQLLGLSEGAVHIQLTEGVHAGPNPFNQEDDLKPWTGASSAAFAIVLILCAVAGSSTYVVQQALNRKQQGDGSLLEGGAQQSTAPFRLPRRLAWCEAFSLIGRSGTWTTLWKCDPIRSTDCLNGMRVICMLFIVLGHGLHEPLDVSGFRNAECIAKTPFCVNAASTQARSYFLLAGQLGVDTFFFIGGFLLSFVGKSRPVPVVLGTALRYARLLPLFGFVMMVYVFITPYLVVGPFAPRAQAAVIEACDNNTWWSELLFISAIYPWFPAMGGCMGWSWYLGVDMVFAVIGVMMLNLWKKNKLIGWLTVLFMFVAGTAITIQQCLYWKLQYNILDPSFGVYGKYLYNRPYHRVPGFVMGLATPWALDMLEKRGITRSTMPRTAAAKVVVGVSLLIALFLAIVCIFLPLMNSQGPGPYATARPGLQWSLWGNALWIGLNRQLWVLSCLILTLACYYDYVPLINGFLAHWMFQPLSALTFGAYLWHPVIIKLAAGNMEDYYNYSIVEAWQHAVFFFVLAYAASTFSFCLVEKPCATLTGWLIKKPKPRETVPCQVAEGAAGGSAAGASLQKTHERSTNQATA